MSQIFICYSRENQDIVKTLANDIKELCHNVWFDHELTGGQAWWDQILERIRKCDIFIFALAPEALSSPACKLELKYASDLCKTILPIMVADGVSIKLLPPALSAIQHVDYRHQDKQSFKSLIKATKTLPAPQPLPDPLPEPPEAPVSDLGNLKEQLEAKETLDREKQSALLFQLEEGLREINDTDEICRLLIQFSKRDDLNAKIGKRIDSLLKSVKVASQGQRYESTTVKPAKKTSDREPEDMILIKGGSFEMGDTFGDGGDGEKPVHEVRVDDFYLGKYPVTVAEFRAFVNDTGYKTEVERDGGMYVEGFWGSKKDPSKYWDNPMFSQTDKHPVVVISWNDAVEYLNWMRNRTGLEYRLPTEAEWEYAARSGGMQEKWSGTNNEGYLETFAWYSNNSGGKTHPVGEKKPNKLGLYDMSGNVWEWCLDWYDKDYYKNSPKDNPEGPSSGEHRVLRGGSWSDNSSLCRCAFRDFSDPGDWYFFIGFRCART